MIWCSGDITTPPPATASHHSIGRIHQSRMPPSSTMQQFLLTYQWFVHTVDHGRGAPGAPLRNSSLDSRARHEHGMKAYTHVRLCCAELQNWLSDANAVHADVKANCFDMGGMAPIMSHSLMMSMKVSCHSLCIRFRFNARLRLDAR